MKKISILIFIVFSLIGCSKDDNDYLKSLIFGQGTFVPILPDGDLLSFSTSKITLGQVLNGSTKSSFLTISNTCKYEIPVNVSIKLGSDLTTSVNVFKIAPNGTFVLSVLYSPKAVSWLNAILQFSYGSVVQSVTISGNGVAELLTVLNSTQVGNLDFGNIIENKTGLKTFTLTNVGTEVAKWTNNQTEIALKPTSGSIPVGASQIVEASFTSTGSGLLTSNIVVAYNGGTFKIPYTVNRIAATRILDISCTTSTAFVNVPNFSTATKTVVISNTGNSDLTVSSLTLNQGTSGIFTCAYAGVIPSGQSVNVVLSFNPQKINVSYSCTIIVQSNRTSGTNSLSFTGKSI